MDLLRKELPRLARDVIACGDWQQPAEGRYRLSRGLLDRMPRYIETGPLAVNKRIAERLFLKTYDLELEQARSYRIWAYRKAAWLVDEYPDSIGELYRDRGETGLRELPGIGKSLAAVIARWLEIDNALAAS